jgi:hypothetical protein
MLTSVGLVKLALNDGGQSAVKVDAVAGSVMGTLPKSDAPAAAAPAAQQNEQKVDAPAPAPVDGANVPK